MTIVFAHLCTVNEQELQIRSCWKSMSHSKLSFEFGNMIHDTFECQSLVEMFSSPASAAALHWPDLTGAFKSDCDQE